MAFTNRKVKNRASLQAQRNRVFTAKEVEEWPPDRGRQGQDPLLKRL